jgi:GAF domain-containing protein
VETELKARASQQLVVAGLGQRALAGTDLLTLMDEAVSLVAQILGVEYCKILELLPDGNALLLRAGVGWKEGYVGHATVGAGTESQAGYPLLSDEPVIVEDLITETRFSGPPLLHDHGVVSGISTIIYGKNQPFGVLGAHTTRRQMFTKDDVHFLQAVANVIAEANERKQAEEVLKESFAKLSKKNRYEAIFLPFGI